MGSRPPGNPLDFFEGVGRSVTSGVEGFMCAVMRKPLPGVLAGATVLIYTGPNTLRATFVRDRVLALGGKVTDRTDFATHCIVREGLGPADLAEHRDQLGICQERCSVLVQTAEGN